MRTNIKSIEHFNNYIERHFNTLVAMYSRGDDIDTISSQFPALIAAMEKGWKDDKEIPADKYQFDDYVLMLHMLSLGVLLNTTDSELEKIVKILDKSGRKDALLEFLISHKFQNRDNVAEMMYENPYKVISVITQNSDKDAATSDLRAFLDKKWYSGMRNVYWYDNHKSRHDTFFGYWSFEVAAVAKIMDLNISELKSNPYFPTDMI